MKRKIMETSCGYAIKQELEHRWDREQNFPYFLWIYEYCNKARQKVVPAYFKAEICLVSPHQQLQVF